MFVMVFYSCGNEGYPSIVRYQFNYKKEIVDSELKRIIKLKTVEIPEKWENYYEKFDFTDDTYVYFNTYPEEIIRVGFARYGDNWEKDEFSNLSMFMWFDGIKWRYNYDISNKERKRIVKRLEDEILSEIKYKYNSKDLRDGWFD